MGQPLIPFTEQELGVTVARSNIIHLIVFNQRITLNSGVLSEEAGGSGGYTYSNIITLANGKPFDSSPDSTGGPINHDPVRYS